MTKSQERAQEIAQILEEENRERQQTELSILKDALEMIADMEDADKRRCMCSRRKGLAPRCDWNCRVTYCEPLFTKPAILISLKDNTIGKAQGRSVKGFNLFDALTHCSDLLLKYGGHGACRRVRGLIMRH